jgi:hypothetical protein
MHLINTYHTMSIQTLSHSAVIPEQSKKIFYIDNLKVGLINLVVLHHALITYGAPGEWYYAQKNGGLHWQQLLYAVW